MGPKWEGSRLEEARACQRENCLFGTAWKAPGGCKIRKNDHLYAATSLNEWSLNLTLPICCAVTRGIPMASGRALADWGKSKSSLCLMEGLVPVWGGPPNSAQRRNRWSVELNSTAQPALGWLCLARFSGAAIWCQRSQRRL